MKRTFYSIIFMTLASVSYASEDAAAFFRNDKAMWTAVAPVQNNNSVAAMVAHSTERKMGRQWVNTALALAKLESGYRCGAVGPRTRHGRAQGVFQVLPGSARALGYNSSRLHECQYGIDVGIAHMQSCISAGVQTHSQMALCHVAGVGGWNKRLNRSAERYKRKYVRLAAR